MHGLIIYNKIYNMYLENSVNYTIKTMITILAFTSIDNALFNIIVHCMSSAALNAPAL